MEKNKISNEEIDFVKNMVSQYLDNPNIAFLYILNYNMERTSRFVQNFLYHPNNQLTIHDFEKSLVLLNDFISCLGDNNYIMTEIEKSRIKGLLKKVKVMKIEHDRNEVLKWQRQITKEIHKDNANPGFYDQNKSIDLMNMLKNTQERLKNSNKKLSELKNIDENYDLMTEAGSTIDENDYNEIREFRKFQRLNKKDWPEDSIRNIVHTQQPKDRLTSTREPKDSIRK